MTNTKTSFKDKWGKNEDLVFLETLREGSDIFNWVLSRNGFQSGEDLQSYLYDKKRVLDAGCGNGRITALLRKYSEENTTEIVGIDLVAADIAKSNLLKYQLDKNTYFYDFDLMKPLEDLGKFDFIYCQEVLHHTENPRQAFLNLCDVLSDSGEIAIYVYKEKAPIREFVDDFVRGQIADLSYEEAMKTCAQITELGKVLANQRITLTVPDVDVLDVKAGQYDLQRFIYHFFLKCFWNENLTFHENTVINYDWYHPQLCSRHNVDEVREWFTDAKLQIVHEYVDFYGITMRGKLQRGL